MRVLYAFLTVSLLFAATSAAAGQRLDKRVKIGVLTDLSSLYSSETGPGSVLAAQMAVADSGMTKKGWTIKVISADFQNSIDVGADIARQWFDHDNVDVILDVPNSAVALAVSRVASEKNAVLLISGAGASELTGKDCSPNMVQWTYDTWMLAHGAAKAIVQAGGETWYFLAVDYVFGKELESEAAAVVKAHGGRILGESKHPLNAADFSSYLLQAKNSHAQVIALADAGGDAMNAIKQAHEFEIASGGQQIAPLLFSISEVHALGLKVAQGLEVTSAFYWDQNNGTRAFAKRFAARMKTHAMPTMAQAGVYASVLHYLKALAALGGNPHNGREVVAKMKTIPTDDPLFGKGEIRVDGRTIHPAYLFKVKTPAESKGPWDLYKLVATIPAKDAFRPLDQGGCPLVKH